MQSTDFPNPGPHLSARLLHGCPHTGSQLDTHPPSCPRATLVCGHMCTSTRSPKDSTSPRADTHTTAEWPAASRGPGGRRACLSAHICWESSCHRPGMRSHTRTAPKLMGTLSPTPQPEQSNRCPSSSTPLKPRPPRPVATSFHPSSRLKLGSWRNLSSNEASLLVPIPCSIPGSRLLTTPLQPTRLPSKAHPGKGSNV